MFLILTSSSMFFPGRGRVTSHLVSFCPSCLERWLRVCQPRPVWTGEHSAVAELLLISSHSARAAWNNDCQLRPVWTGERSLRLTHSMKQWPARIRTTGRPRFWRPEMPRPGKNMDDEVKIWNLGSHGKEKSYNSAKSKKCSPKISSQQLFFTRIPKFWVRN